MLVNNRTQEMEPSKTSDVSYGRALAGAIILAACALAALLWALAPQPSFGSASAGPGAAMVVGQSAPAADACDGINTVPADECRALVALYNATDGPHWRANDGWLDFGGSAPCDWHGVTCSAGRVTALALAANGMAGTVPRAICALDQVATADFGYNQLQTFRPHAYACLTALDPDWVQTQTVPPRRLRISAFFTDALSLAWMPISYTADSGYYEIAYAIDARGPYTPHGRTDDKSASSYHLDGLEPGRGYFVRVRTVTLANDHLPADLPSEGAPIVGVTRSEEKVLLAVYFPADNDLAPYIGTILNRLRLGTALNPNIQVLFLADGRREDDTRVVAIHNGVATPTGAVMQQWGTQELDTADPAVLAWFLQYARDTYPAQKTVVSLMGHGLPLVPELVWPSDPVTAAQSTSGAATPSQQIPPLPQQWDDTPGDITSRTYMSVFDVAQALAIATDQGAKPFDLLFFDQCFQGNLDTLYQIHWAADVFVASANYAWLAAPYEKYLTQLTPAATSAEMADAILTIYQSTLNNQHPNAIFAVRGVEIPAIAGAVSDLGQALRQALQSGGDDAIAAIEAAAVASQYVDTNQCEQPTFTLGQPDELMGVGSFASYLQTAFGSGDSFGVSTAAEEVLAALAQVRSNARIGRPYLAPDTIWAYDDSFTVLAPLARDAGPATAWRTSLYRETSGYSATWTLVPTQTVVVSGVLAFVQDGAWDEFLAEWYTSPLTPTVGPWCHYIPPEQVSIEDSEALSLTASVGSAGARSVHLAWSATSDERATNYWLFAWGPGDVSWTIADVLPLEQTSYEGSALFPGDYYFAVFARDESGSYVAGSSQVDWRVSRRLPLFVPVVRR